MILGLCLNINAQDKGGQTQPNSVLQAPRSITKFIPTDPAVESYRSRWFGIGVFGVTAVLKSFLNTPSTLTQITPTARAIFAGALSGAGVWYGFEYLAAGSGNLVTIDTTTGAIVTVGALSGLAGGHTVTGLSWDKTSSIMYGLSTNGTVGTLYTVNLTNGALTTIGNTAGSALPIDMSFNNAGVLYSVDIGTDLLNTINKTTGAATSVGPLGVDLNFAQGMCFDPETDSLFLAAYNLTVSTGQLLRCNTTTGQTTLIGNFGTSQSEVDGFIIPGGVARPLNAFNLQTPPSGTRVVTVAGSTTPVDITWDTSAAGANYKFIFGNPTVPPRRLTIPSNTNSITTTLGALDIVLAANGFTNNGSATDSAVGQWDVWAFKGPNAPGPDSLKSTNGPRAITLKRQQVSLSAFSLSSPASGITVVTSPVDLTTITFSWTRSAQGASYRWLYKTGTFSDPPTFRILSNNGGLDTFWTVRNSRLDSLLAGVGVNSGDSVTGQWRARAYATGDSLNSNSPDRTITFRRVGLLPLNQDFASTTFPPPFWALDAGGAPQQYWTRDAVSGYQNGSGSAKFDFWSALSTTPLQSLISNQFPPVTANNNVLKFDYSHAYYLSGGTLANDSCIIETSVNNGSTWTRLIGMGASQILSSGTNSSPVMSTFASQSLFTPTLASQWATKLFNMPVGTNKVRFVGKSDFGNNLYIDNIIATGSVGIGGHELTLTPDRYSLEQNYPNPFNPSTSINFSIPNSGLVTLKIYDILGKEVVTLVNEVKTAGNYILDFNASALTSGVYFYKIESGSFTDIKRMMLIK